jgi:type I restriction enzyme M protein
MGYGVNMDHATHNKIVSFIWSIADDCLRDGFVRGKYRDVILPMFVLRRIDCLLEDSKEAVLAEVKIQKEEAGMAVLDPNGLRDAAGQVFYITSPFTLKSLLGNPSQLYEKLRKNLGEKNCAFTPAHIEQITRAYLDLGDTGKEAVDGLKARVFDNRDFGCWKITVERPLRKSTQFTTERVASLRFDKRLTEEMQWIYQQWEDHVYATGFLNARKQKDSLDDWLEKEGIDRKAADKKRLLDRKFWETKRSILQAAEQLHQSIGVKVSNDFNLFQKDVKAALKKLKLKLGASELKAILEAVSWRDPDAEPILASGSRIDGAKYEPDSELRDTENVPLNYEGGMDTYFAKEVLPHVPDAWIDESKTVIGYEISFNKYFYVHQPLRDLGEVVQEIRELEKGTEGVLESILDFTN